ncbi:MAG: AsmA family protein, partial [Planctomycetota bacterium]
LIKGWHLRAYRSLGDGSLNLAHLFQRQGPPPKSWDRSSLSRLISSHQSLELSEGRIEYAEGRMGHRDWQVVSGRLDGSAHFLPPNEAQGQGASIRFRVNGLGDPTLPKSRIHAQYEIRNFLFARQGLRGDWGLLLQGEELPLPRLTRLFRFPAVTGEPHLLKGSAKLNGHFGTTPRTLLEEVHATVDRLALPVLGLTPPIQLSMKAETIDESTEKYAAPPLKRRFSFASPTLKRQGSLEITPNSQAGARVVLTTTMLDLAHLPPEGDWLARVLPSRQHLTLSADRLTLHSLPATQVHGTIQLSGRRFQEAEMTGRFGQGALRLHARKGLLGGSSLPEGLSLTIDAADATELCRAVTTLFPPALHLQPREGKISLALLRPEPGAPTRSVAWPSALLRQAHKYHRPGTAWSLLTRIDEPLLFEEPGTNSVLTALWKIPIALKTVRNRISPPTEKGNSHRLTALHLERGILVSDEQGQTVAELASKELGALNLHQEKNLLLLKAYPLTAALNSEETPILPPLPKDILKAAHKVERKTGLTLTIPLNGKDAHMNLVEDILQRWIKDNPKAARQRNLSLQESTSHAQ